MTEQGFQPTDAPLGVAERADYLDTQTLAGGDGYFHTENAPTHATDGSAKGQSPETPLVAASRATGDSQAVATTSTGAASTTNVTARVATPEDDGLESLTNQKLAKLAKERGVALPRRANKAQMISALRG